MALSRLASTPHEPWPWHKVEARLKTQRPSEKKPAVVFASGSLSPTHRGHVLMLHQAEDRLARAGYEVIGGWLSPSHDLSVLADAKARSVPELRHDFRVHVAELSVKEDKLVAVGSWESDLEKAPTDLDVAISLHKAVNARFSETYGSNTIKVYCVCGCDHLAKFNLRNGFTSSTYSSSLGVVAVPREGTDEVLLEKPGFSVYVADATPGEAAALSSTKLRQAIIDGDTEYAKNALFPEAARCVLQPTLREQQLMRIDFENLGIINPALDIIATDGPWPLANMLKRMAETTQKDVPAVLIVSGSMSPVHVGYFEVLRRGRERLERAGFKVLAGFLSPQNAIGAAAEMRAARGSEEETALSTSFRLKTTGIAVSDDDFISLGAWEASVMGKVSTPHEVMSELSKYLHENIPALKTLNNELRIFYACGPGQAARRGLNKSIGVSNMGIVIVPREGEDNYLLEKPCNLFYVADEAVGEPNIVVAAKIRAAVQSGSAAYVTSNLPTAVARFVLSPTESELEAFKTDFEYLRPKASQGSLRLTEPAMADEAKAKFKVVLQAWAGPTGAIAIEDITRLLEVLDPSWTNSELSTFSSGAFGAVNKAGQISCDDLVEWMFTYEK